MFDIHQMIDSIIEEEYALFKGLVGGNYTAFCTLYADIMGKLAALREGAKKDADAKKAQMEELKRQLERASTPQEFPESGGVIGGETVSYDFSEKGDDDGTIR